MTLVRIGAAVQIHCGFQVGGLQTIFCDTDLLSVDINCEVFILALNNRVWFLRVDEQVYVQHRDE